MTRSRRTEIERALSFIGAELERPLTAAKVARAAHLSEFHLQRVFHAEVGESVGRFITRRRLELAALRLAYQGDRSITDIALSSGYSSSSNFAKAFSAYFGCSPTAVREPTPGVPASIGKLLSQYGKNFRPEALYSLPGEVGREQRRHEAASWSERVRFETVPARSFACLASPAGYDFSALEKTWNELITLGQQLGLCEEAVDAWGMAHDSPELTAPELCRYQACVPCDPQVALPAPLTRGQMHAGRYAIFLYAGPVSAVAEAYRSIYSCWFPESGLVPEDFVPVEHHINDFPQNGQIEFEIWFRIRTRQR